MAPQACLHAYNPIVAYIALDRFVCFLCGSDSYVCCAPWLCLLYVYIAPLGSSWLLEYSILTSMTVFVQHRSRIMTGDDKGKQPEESAWVRKAPTKEPEFNLEHAKETFMEANKTCMKLPHDSKAVKEPQELITRCVGT